MGDQGQLEICIGPDGRVYVEGMSEELLEIAAAISPYDPMLGRRVELLAQARAQRRQQGSITEQQHGTD